MQAMASMVNILWFYCMQYHDEVVTSGLEDNFVNVQYIRYVVWFEHKVLLS